MSYLSDNSPEYFTSSPFCEAVNSFNARNWYLAHDQFEELWHQASGEKRELLQGIIQISVAEYHLENGNIMGSTLLMAEGLNHLGSITSHGVGYDLVLLQDLVRKRLSALQNQTDPSAFPIPYLKSL
jgi:hypothetical protein